MCTNCYSSNRRQIYRHWEFVNKWPIQFTQQTDKDPQTSDESLIMKDKRMKEAFKKVLVFLNWFVFSCRISVNWKAKLTLLSHQDAKISFLYFLAICMMFWFLSFNSYILSLLPIMSLGDGLNPGHIQIINAIIPWSLHHIPYPDPNG